MFEIMHEENSNEPDSSLSMSGKRNSSPFSIEKRPVITMYIHSSLVGIDDQDYSLTQATGEKSSEEIK